jgi:hypothetical protein
MIPMFCWVILSVIVCLGLIYTGMLLQHSIESRQPVFAMLSISVLMSLASIVISCISFIQ